MRATGTPLALALLVLPAALLSATPQADLAAGVEQVKQGNFAEAVITLDHVLSQLSAETADPQELTQAHLYLGVAYAGLDQSERAKAEFREALRRAPELRLSAEEFSSKAVELFEAARADASAASPPAATTPPATEAKAAPAPTPSEPPERVKRSRLKRGLIIAGGGAAATVGVVALKGTNHPPTASLVAAPEGTAINGVTEIRFTAIAADPDQDTLVFDWTFGDGRSASGLSVTHVFGGEGTFDVTLTVRDGHGGSATARTTVQARTVTGVYHPDNADLRDYELHQNGSALTGVVGPCCEQVPFQGTLASPRDISLAYIFIDEGRTCHESITGVFDETLTRITGIYSCTGCRQCRKSGTFPVVLTRQ